MEQFTVKNIEQQVETVIGPSVKIEGDLNSEGDVRIEGQVTGKINSLKKVFIEQNAKLAADVEANEVTIAGEVQGKLNVLGLLILQSTAKVSGEITCPVLRVEDGAILSAKFAVTGKQKQIA